jgi:hypothetical protein
MTPGETSDVRRDDRFRCLKVVLATQGTQGFSHIGMNGTELLPARAEHVAQQELHPAGIAARLVATRQVEARGEGARAGSQLAAWPFQPPCRFCQNEIIGGMMDRVTSKGFLRAEA